jgi:DNA (cytosine-5)-methyltransferase 1
MREVSSGEAIIRCVEYMYEKNHDTEMIHARILQNGSQTVLGNAANEREVFFFNYSLGPQVPTTTFKSY